MVVSKKIKCGGKCGKEKPIGEFYNTTSPAFPTGKMTICKKCLKNLVDYNDMSTVYSVLQAVDVPFLYDIWDNCVVKGKEKKEDGKNYDVFGNYIRMANSGLNEFKGRSFKDSIFENSSTNANQYHEEDFGDLYSDFKPTKEIVTRWGRRDNEEYIKLENFYVKMKENNNIETAADEDYLKKLAVISMKMDKELDEGNYSQAKQLGDLFSKYMADSKFRAMDKTAADKTGGLRNFSTIYMEVESDDFIPPWEYYRKIKGLTQDIVDKTIMHIENFTLRLNRAERMTEPPVDTPEVSQEETTEILGDING